MTKEDKIVEVAKWSTILAFVICELLIILVEVNVF